MTDRVAIERLIAARHPCVAISTFEEDYVLSLLREIALERSQELWLWTVSQGVRDGMLAGSTSLADTEHPAAALYFAADQQRGGIWVMTDLAGHLKDERTLRVLREAIARFGAAGGGATLVLIDHRDDLPAVIRGSALAYTISLPDETELEAIVKQTLREANEQQRIECSVSRQDLRTIIRNLRGLTRRQARQVILDIICDDRRLDAGDVDRVLAEKRQALGDGLLEYVRSPVTLDELGGLVKLKAWLGRRAQCSGEEASAFGISPPRGMLLLGVQGAGKSLAAKAVATAWRQPLLRMDAGALYDRYIGESDRRLRDALAQAERMAPVVLWIDEIEKGFASAASQSSDGGLSKRMFGALLTWMQDRTAPVFLVATANDIEALPPELLRKGRFDEIFFVDLPNLEARATIVSIHLSKRKRDPVKFDLGRIAESAEGRSGAEIEAAVIGALHDAFAAGSQLTTDHIVAALAASPPLSVTMAERMSALRAWSVGRCVPAD